MNVGGGKRLGEHAARLVVEERHLVDLQQLRQRHELAVACAGSDDENREVVEVTQERRRANERVEVLRMADVPGVHDDELLVHALLSRPVVGFVTRRQPLGVDPVRDHLHTLGRCTFLLETPAHRVADRNDPVRAPEVERHERTKEPHHDGILEALQLNGDLRKDVLADHDERGAVATRDEQRDVCHDRGIGHAEHDVRARAAQAAQESIRKVGDVIRGPSEEPAAFEGRRGHTLDLDGLVHQPSRLVLVTVQHARDDLHLDVLRERLAEIREQLRRRLDPRPVVLIQDKEARLAGRRHRARLVPDQLVIRFSGLPLG